MLGRVGVALCLSLAIGLVASVAPPSRAPTALAGPSGGVAPQAQPITIGILGIIGDAPFHIARERGYFGEQALTPDLQLFDSGARMVPALATGQLDVAPGSPGVGLYNAILRGVQFRLVGDFASASPEIPGPAWIII